MSKKLVLRARRELVAMFGDAPIKPQYVVATIQQQVVGVAGYIQAWMNVTPDYQQHGIGSKLVEVVIRKIKRKQPSVILLTTTQPGFYGKKFKFKRLVTFPNWRRGRDSNS